MIADRHRETLGAASVTLMVLAGAALVASPSTLTMEAHGGAFLLEDTFRFAGSLPAGAHAFELELGQAWDDPPSGSMIEVAHSYRDDGFGSTPPFAANFLVPQNMLLKPRNLWPGELGDPVPRSEWGHHYGVTPFWPSQHVFTMRTQDDHEYLNPNDTGTLHRTVSYRPEEVEPERLAPGPYWWVFIATSPQNIEIKIPHAHLIDGPMSAGLQEHRLLTSSPEFETQMLTGSHPSPGIGLASTLGALTSIVVDGPAYMMAHGVFIAPEGSVQYRLLDPTGEQVPMRQKRGMGVAGGSLLLAEAHNTQADLLVADSGEWRVEFDAAAATLFDFRLFVLDLEDLVAPPV